MKTVGQQAVERMSNGDGNDTPPGWDAFISYRRLDGARVAAWLRHYLETFRATGTGSTKQRKLRCYLDKSFRKSTSNFPAQLDDALARSRHLVVIATPSAMLPAPDGGPNWLVREVESYCRSHQAPSILIVRGAGERDGPLPADLNARFPNADIADLRGAGRWFRARGIDDPEDEALTIAATLLGVPIEALPDFRREDERRRRSALRKRQRTLAAVVAVVSGLLVAAVWQLRAATEHQVALHTASGEMLFPERPVEAGLRYIEARRLADTFGWLGVTAPVADAALAAVPRAPVNWTKWLGPHAGDASMSADSSWIAAIDGPAHVHAWSNHQDVMWETPEPITAVRVHSNGSLAAHSKSTLFIRDPDGISVRVALDGGAMTKVAWHASKSQLAIANGCKFRIVSADGKKVRDLPMESCRGGSPEEIDWIVGVDNTWVVSLDQRRLVTWTGQVPTVLPLDKNSFFDMPQPGVAGDGLLPVAVGRTTVDLYDIETASLAHLRFEHPATVRAAAVDPIGKYLATAASDGIARIWSLDEPHLRPVEIRHAAPLVALALSPDGKRIATGDQRGVVRMWDADSGDAAGLPRQHGGPIAILSWLRTERTLASVAWDGSAAVGAVSLRRPDVVLALDGAVKLQKDDDAHVIVRFASEGRFVTRQGLGATAPNDGNKAEVQVNLDLEGQEGAQPNEQPCTVPLPNLPSMIIVQQGCELQRRFAWVVAGRAVWAWDLASRHAFSWTASANEAAPQRVLDLSRDRSRLLLELDNGHIEMRALRAGLPRASRSFDPETPLRGRAGVFVGEALVAVDQGRSVAFWDLDSGREVTSLPVEDVVLDLVAGEDGELIVLFDDKLSFWDLRVPHGEAARLAQEARRDAQMWLDENFVAQTN